MKPVSEGAQPHFRLTCGSPPWSASGFSQLHTLRTLFKHVKRRVLWHRLENNACMMNAHDQTVNTGSRQHPRTTPVSCMPSPALISHIYDSPMIPPPACMCRERKLDRSRNRRPVLALLSCIGHSQVYKRG